MQCVPTGASRRLRWGCLSLTAIVALVAVASDPADARGRRKRHHAKQAAAADSYSPPYADIVVDAKTGAVLHQANPDAPRHPASLTKIMTLYLLFEQIESGKIKLDSEMPVSEEASAQAPTKLGLKPGETLKVEDAIKGLVTKSANDAAVVVAEALGGSEQEFAKMMTRKARAIGMRNTTYHNASGLPDDAQISTARDQALLGIAIQERFPKYYRYFSLANFVYRGSAMRNHNHLLGKVDGVDGIKTGYTRASGFNLVTSVTRGNRRIVAVVIGGETGGARDALMARLVGDYIAKASSNSKLVAAIPGKVSKPGTAVATAKTPTLRPDAGDAAVATAPDGDQTDAIAAVVQAAPAKAAKPLTIASLTAGANSLFAIDQTTDSAEGDLAVDDETSDEALPAGSTQRAPALQQAAKSGWRIQLAAAPSKGQAEDLLDRALAKGATVLADASPYTEAVSSGGTTLYRARFAGFAGKDEAWKACAYLEKLKFSCLAVSN
jgi:D-alanyl-D-alanine carboxypeptidase